MQQSSGHFFEFFHFIDDHSQCEDEGQGIGGRTGSEHTDNTHRLGQQQGDRDEKHDLSGQRDDGRLDGLADCLQVDGGDGLEAVERAEHEEDAEALDRKFVVQTFLEAEDRDHAHRCELEDKESDDCDNLGGSDGDFKGTLDAVEVFAAVVEADDRLRADRDTDQNGQHDLVDLHDDAHGGQRNLGAVNRSRTVDGEQVVEKCHHDGTCNLGDEAADPQTEDAQTDALVQAQRRAGRSGRS